MMNTALACIFWGLVVAAPPSAVWPAAATPRALTGRVLVLENERALEGDIRWEGGQYSIRRTVGEMWLPGDKVLKLCATWDEAFATVRAQANLRDPDERLRLARWCQVYGLRDQALAEATAAVQMRPSHAASRQLLTLVQRSTSVAQNPSPAPSPRSTREYAALAPSIDLSGESLSMFTTRVQPVLMNTCASCHAAGKATAFSLSRAYGSNTASRRATQHNLAAVLAQVDPEHPHGSPLLMRAITDHGKVGQAPLKAQSPPHRILQEWIQLTLASNPFLREQRLAAPASSLVGTAKVPPEPASGSSRAPGDSSLPGGTTPVAPETMTTLAPVISRPLSAPRNPSAPAADEQPTATAVAPVDDFDPAPYNRQFHPSH